MNFKINKKSTALILIGQMRLLENQTVDEKMQYHLNNFDYDKLYCFLWDDEYELYGKEMEKYNPTFIIGDSSLKNKICTEYELQHANRQLREYDAHKIVYVEKVPLNYEREKKHIEQYMVFFYILQTTFRNINLDHDLYIKTRYDNVYLSDYKQDVSKAIVNLKQNSDKPILLQPFGGDADNIGLSDLLTTFNTEAAKIYVNFLDELKAQLLSGNGTPSPEKAFRFIFRNLHNTEIYRFCTGCTTQRMQNDGYTCHPTYETMKQYYPNIDIRNLYDNSKLPIVKAPKTVDIYFDLPLVEKNK